MEVNNVHNVNTLLPESLREIMLNMDIDTLMIFYTTHKSLQPILDKNFWLAKFKLDNVPLLYEIHKENIDLMDAKDPELNEIIIDNLPKEPTSIKTWIKLYKDAIFYISQATRLVDDIEFTDHFKLFDAALLDFDEFLWLPVKWFEMVHNKYGIHQVHYNLEDGYKMILYTNNFKTNGIVELDEMVLTRNEFIIYIAKLIYFNTNYDKEKIFLMGDDDALYISDLMSTKPYPIFNMLRVD